MLLDQNAMLSEKQSVSATAASTNVIDLTAAGNVAPGSLFFVAQVDTAFSGEGSLKIALQTSDSSAFNSVTELMGTTYAAAALGPAGAVLCSVAVPAGLKRYVRAYYTVSNVSGGKLTCFLTDGVDQK